MAKKSKEPELSPEEKALQERVDSMMDVKRTEVAEVAAGVNESLAQEFGVDKDAHLEKVEEKIESEAVDVPAAVGKPKTAMATAPELPDKSKPKSAEPKKEEPEPAEEPVPDEPDEPEEAAEPEEKSADIDDGEIDKAVDDIVAHESDTMLAIENAKVNKQKAIEAHAQTHKSKSGAWAWLLLVLLLAAAGAYLYVTDYEILDQTKEVYRQIKS